MRVATQLHRLTEMLGADADPFDGVAHYVIDQTLLDMAVRTDVQDSIAAMIEAEVAHLPHSPIVLEFEIAASARRFVRLAEDSGQITALAACLYRDRAATLAKSSAQVTVTAGGIAVSDGTAGADGHAIALAVAMALLLLNTRGVARDVIDTSRLNKARALHGKPRIPAHTLLRVGTVYDQSDRPVAMAGGRKSMRVHWRQGHARSQAHGPGRSDRRVVYIWPVLVNYAGGEVLVPQKIVAR